MYHTHWGLKRPPFAGGTADRMLYEGASQAEALSRVRFLVNQRRRAGLLTGEQGSGKTLLLEMFREQCRRIGLETAQLALGGATSRELLWQLASQLGLLPGIAEETPRLFRRLVDYAMSVSQQETHVVLLLDDADETGPDTLGLVVRLLGIGLTRGWCTAIVSAQTSRFERLGGELLELCDLRVDLEPWDESDTTAYVQFALFEAGCDRPLFDSAALSSLFHLSAGLPRRVKRLAEHALLAAAGRGISRVDAEAVEVAHQELRWASAPQ
jgi:type II secretory pathway predicted ATPase ExeA